MVELSIIVPAYNESGNIKLLHLELIKVLSTLNKDYEIIFVDDGSTDDTFEEIEKLHIKDKSVKAIKFRRNFGKASALSAGWGLAKGKVIIQMDADLQDDPREIPRFLAELDKYDLITGWKYRRHDPWTKTAPSKLFNWITAKSTGVKIHDSNCGFKCYKREVIQNINLYGELHRYIPALAYWKGFKIGEIRVNHKPREHGKSKYGFSRLFKGLFDLITVKYLTSYVTRPLHFFGSIGFLLELLGFIGGIYMVYLKIIGESISDRPLLILTVLLIILGAQSILMGLLGEMITNQSQKENYSIEKIITTR